MSVSLRYLNSMKLFNIINYDIDVPIDTENSQ